MNQFKKGTGFYIFISALLASFTAFSTYKMFNDNIDAAIIILLLLVIIMLSAIRFNQN